MTLGCVDLTSSAPAMPRSTREQSCSPAAAAPCANGPSHKGKQPKAIHISSDAQLARGCDGLYHQLIYSWHMLQATRLAHHGRSRTLFRRDLHGSAGLRRPLRRCFSSESEHI